jgi:hypothetical protein
MGEETKSAHRILVKEVPAELYLEDLEPEETINLRLVLLLGSWQVDVVRFVSCNLFNGAR